MKLSVIMPVYSETDSVRRIIDDISVRIKEHLLEVILIVSPRSSEESLAVCRSVESGNRLVRMIIQSELPGFGQAYREAFPAARGDFVLMLDADGEFDLDSVPLMIREVERGAEAVLASRWISGGGVEGYGFVTYLANRSFQILLRTLFRTRLHDLTFGFKLLSAGAVRTIPWEGTMHELAMETTIKTIRYGYRVTEVPAFWRKRREGQSKNKSLLWRARRYLPLMISVLRSAPPPGTPAYARHILPPLR